jgi:hypothetical protein
MSLQSSLLSTAAISQRKRGLSEEANGGLSPHRFSQAWDCTREVTERRITGLASNTVDGLPALLVYTESDGVNPGHRGAGGVEPVRQRQASRRPRAAETFWNGRQSQPPRTHGSFRTWPRVKVNWVRPHSWPFCRETMIMTYAAQLTYVLTPSPRKDAQHRQ